MIHFVDFLQAYTLNSLWQVPLLCAAAWLVVRMLPLEGAALHHRVWVGALLLEAVLPACRVPDTLLVRLVSLFQFSPVANASVSFTVSNGAVVHGSHGLPSMLWTLTVLYGGVSLYFAARLVYRLLCAHTLRRRAQPLTLQPTDSAVLAACCERLRVRTVAVATSNEVAGPVTLGTVQPVLLLPPWVLARGTTADLHTALAHEVAHVSRHDFTKNLLYQVLSLPAAYHPCAWLTRQELVEGREVICDGIAADLLSGREAYARSLLRLAAMLIGMPPAKQSHAIGIFDAHIFERRIMTLTKSSPIPAGPRRLLSLAGCGAIALFACASALALHLNVAAMAAPAPLMTGAADHPVKVSAGVMAANAESRTVPVYPPEAKKAKISGAVVLHAIIGKTGAVESLQVESGPDELRASALDAVRQWKYKPFLLNGDPVDVETTVTVTYSFSQ